jgi:TldD protein
MKNKTLHLNKLLAEFEGLSLPVEYWDVRIEDSFETQIQLVNGEIVNGSCSPSIGAFLRVKKNNFWFYQSTTDLDSLKETLLELSQSQIKGTTQEDVVEYSKQDPVICLNSIESKFSSVPLEKKLILAQDYDKVMSLNPNVASRNLRYKDIYKVKSFLNSLGTQFEYDFNQGGFACSFVLKKNEMMFDDFFRIYGSNMDQLENHQKSLDAFMKEAESFLEAPAIKPGKYRVVLDPEVAGVFTHESFGHKSEADFMLGNSEALENWKLGKKIGSDCLTIVDHGMRLGTSGYCPIDDDGTPSQKNYLIKNGVLTGRLHSRETAAALKEPLTGNSRAMSFEFEPIVRMTSTYIEPGSESIDSILKRCEGAIYVEGVKHGSGLSTFTIAPTRGYRIGKDGTKTPVRLTVISGSVFETLRNIEFVSKEFVLHSSALGGCGKMEQWPLPVADGGPFVVVTEMQVS